MANHMASQVFRPSHAQPASRVRYWVVVFAVTLAIITYIDRVTMSFARGAVARDLHLDDVQMGYIFSSFIAAYALFEIPSGFLGDWIGARRVLMRVVVWWSGFMALTGSTWNFHSLVTTQTLFGAGEAGCFPNLTKAFTAWLPGEERVRAQGIMWLAARWGGAFTPLLAFAVLQVVSWRNAFRLFGLIGVVWAIVFYRWYRDNPKDNPSVNPAELELIRGGGAHTAGHGHVPWRRLFSSRQVLLLCAQYFCLSYGWYFYVTWLPTYLQQARHLQLGKSALLSALPLFFGGIGCLVAGFVATRLTRLTGSTSATRKLLAYIGFPGAALLLVLSTRMPNPVTAMLTVGLASFCNDLVMPGAWGACMDVGGRFAGTVSGMMNTMGNFGGSLCPVAVGYILSLTHHNWDVTFYVSAAIYVMGIFCWMALDPVSPLERTERLEPVKA